MIRNIASDFKNEIFPVSYRFGVGSRFYKNKLRIAFDIDTKNDIANKEGISYKIHSGIEWTLKIIVLRLGYDDGKLTYGFGLIYKNLQFDYTSSINEIIGNTHRFSMSIRFGTQK